MLNPRSSAFMGEIFLSQVERTYGKSPGQIYAMETMKLLKGQAGR